MMNKLSTIFCFVLISLLMSCKEDKASLDLRFHASHDGNVLTMLEKNQLGDLTLRYTISDMFISDITLISDDKNLVLSDIEFIDFSNVNTSVERAMEGIGIQYPDIEIDDYHTISFGVGVTEENNSKTPSDFSSDNVLSQAGYYWPSWNSYTFIRIEAKYDTEFDGSFDEGCVFHVGGNNNYARVEIPIDLAIDAGSNTLDLFLDHDKLFETEDGNYFDIPSMPFNHHPDLPGIINISRNLPSAWTAE